MLALSLTSLSLKNLVKLVEGTFLNTNRELLMKSTVKTKLLARLFSIRAARICSKTTPEPTTVIKAKVPKTARGVKIKKRRKRRRFSNLKEELSAGKSISLNISREDLKEEAIFVVKEIKLVKGV